jgi:hypothetical protein
MLGGSQHAALLGNGRYKHQVPELQSAAQQVQRAGYHRSIIHIRKKY